MILALWVWLCPTRIQFSIHGSSRFHWTNTHWKRKLSLIRSFPHLMSSKCERKGTHLRSIPVSGDGERNEQNVIRNGRAFYPPDAASVSLRCTRTELHHAFHVLLQIFVQDDTNPIAMVVVSSSSGGYKIVGVSSSAEIAKTQLRGRWAILDIALPTGLFSVVDVTERHDFSFLACPVKHELSLITNFKLWSFARSDTDNCCFTCSTRTSNTREN